MSKTTEVQMSKLAYDLMTMANRMHGAANVLQPQTHTEMILFLLSEAQLLTDLARQVDDPEPA